MTEHVPELILSRCYYRASFTTLDSFLITSELTFLCPLPPWGSGVSQWPLLLYQCSFFSSFYNFQVFAGHLATQPDYIFQLPLQLSMANRLSMKVSVYDLCVPNPLLAGWEWWDWYRHLRLKRWKPHIKDGSAALLVLHGLPLDCYMGQKVLCLIYFVLGFLHFRNCVCTLTNILGINQIVPYNCRQQTFPS